MSQSIKKEKGWLNRTVFGAGLTSALGDFCYETTTAILPGFLTVLGIPAAVLGIIDGICDAMASFTKMWSGFIADKFGHRKTIVLFGYVLAPLGQVFFALALAWPFLLIGRLSSYFGKGLRGPLRDAIMVNSANAQVRGRVFGFHRGMDALGSVAGPLIAVLLLKSVEDLQWQDLSDPFRFVLWLSVIPGVLAVMTFAILVKDSGHSPNPKLQFLTEMRNLPTRFKSYLKAIGLFGIGDFSHSLLVLAATQLLTGSMGIVQAAQIAGLLYVLRNFTQVALSYPIGVLADRFNALSVLILGYSLGALTAILTALAFIFHIESILLLGIIFFIAGLCFAIQDALESAVTASMVNKETIATSYGALGMVNGSANLFSSTSVGLLWTFVSPVAGFSLAATLMVIGTIALIKVKK